ncbi:SGNH/GDSL hydrolase family protein [uncultured Bacteroides sp.]
MRKNRNRVSVALIFVLWGILGIFFLLPETALAQDRIPACPPLGKTLKMIKPLREMNWANDTISVLVAFPATFRGTGRNEIVDNVFALTPLLERLRQVRAGFSEDTVRIVHIGDSHVRGHIYPRTAGALLAETFGAVSYTDMGVNGATCLTFTHPERIADIAALKPELLILSFGTNESHNRRYNTNLHYNQMDELVKLLRDSLPDVPIILTTPPGSYESFRQRKRRRTYAINPRTAIATETIHHYARNHNLVVWDMYEVVGGKRRACTNWTEAKLMRPDHVHYLPEGYILQGTLLYQALIKAYNDYVSR